MQYVGPSIYQAVTSSSYAALSFYLDRHYDHNLLPLEREVPLLASVHTVSAGPGEAEDIPV